MTSYPFLQIESQERFAIVRISHAEALNALNREVLQSLSLAFADFAKQPQNVAGVILTGAGDKAFVAGADIAAMQDMTALQADEFANLGHQLMQTIENFHGPVIAMVNGFALGGGLELALACDFIYASDTAKFGLPEVNLGLFPGFGGTQRLLRVVGRAKAKELIFTARMVSASEAKTWGLVNQVFSAAELLPETLKTMQLMLSKGPIALKLAKRVINAGADLPLASALELERGQFPLVFTTEDCAEGVSAFLQKRKPNFIGK